MGDESDVLLGMIGRGARVAVIQNALDNIPEENRRQYAARASFQVHDWLRDQGLQVVDLDLRDFFGDRASVGDALDGIDLVWATGGNAFLLLRAIRQSGLEVPLKRRLAENSIVYGGWSAGACVAGASLEGVHLMDEPYAVAEGYRREAEWQGMGLVDFAIVPHFRSAHGESAAAEVAAAWLSKQRLPFRTLRDGESIIIDERD